MSPEKVRAWVLDLQPKQKGILFWLKQESGDVLKALYPFDAFFYAEPQENINRDICSPCKFINSIS